MSYNWVARLLKAVLHCGSANDSDGAAQPPRCSTRRSRTRRRSSKLEPEEDGASDSASGCHTAARKLKATRNATEILPAALERATEDGKLHSKSGCGGGQATGSGPGQVRFIARPDSGATGTRDNSNARGGVRATH